MIEIDLSGLRKLEVFATFAAFMASVVYGWLLLRLRSEFAPAVKVLAQGAEIDGIKARLGTIEGAVNHLPTREDTHQLALSLADMRGDLRGVAARLDGIEKVISATGRRVELIDEHLKSAG